MRLDDAASRGPVIVVAGARPNFVKVVPILRELDRRGIPRVFVHTGQHYDVQMSEALLHDLEAPAPDYLLDVGSGTHAVQTARVLERFEPLCFDLRPSWVVVVGDVNSTLACALVVAKVGHLTGTRVAHVESGLRSGDWTMPEEVNRVLTDRMSDLLLTTSRSLVDDLASEGIPRSKVEFVGNVMLDPLYALIEKARGKNLLERLKLDFGGYCLVTLHRPANVDDEGSLRSLLHALADYSEHMPVVFPVHPRTRRRAEEFGLGELLRKLVVTEPLSYLGSLQLQDGAAAVVTDSGGIQQESTVLGVPCLTVRPVTEWPDTITVGTNRLASWPLSRETLLADIGHTASKPKRGLGASVPDGWDGRAAERIVGAILARSPGVRP